MKDASSGGTMALTGWGEGQEPAVVPGLFDSPIPTPTPIPPATIEGLIAALDAAYQQGQIDNEGVYHSLRAKLTQAQDDINQGQTDKAVQELEAFVNEVEAQRGKHVTEEAADRLIALAQRLIAQLQGETPPPIPDPRSAIQNPPASITYTYDDLYRLTAAEYSTGESFAYTYDAVGNRLSLVTGSGSTSYVYDAADRLTSVNGVGYTWDDNGNLLSDGTRTFAYDAADRLTGVSGGGVNAAYTYNGDGLRVGQTLNGQGTTFTWDVAASLPQVLATSDGAAYVLGLSLLAQQQSGAWQYPLPDGLGSLRQWTDVGGQVTYAARYAPFGSLLWQQGTAPAPWGFAGEMQDPTGLLYLRARWYDPTTGRFLTRDPFPGLVTLPSTQHPYVYVGNNPVNLTDPTGEFIVPLLLAVGVGAAIGGVGGGVGYALAHPGGRPEDYLRDAGFRRAVGVGALSGAVAGGVGFGVGGLVAGLPGLGGAVLGGALTGAAASGTGQATANLLTPCVKWNTGLGQAALYGAISGGIAGGVGYGIRWFSSRGARPPWLSWEQYEKVTIDGKVYAKVGGRLYTQHAVERTYPSGLGRAARPGGVQGRSVAPAFVEDVLTSPLASQTSVTGPHGEVRISHVLGTLEVITEGDIVITIMTH